MLNYGQHAKGLSKAKDLTRSSIKVDGYKNTHHDTNISFDQMYLAQTAKAAQTSNYISQQNGKANTSRY